MAKNMKEFTPITSDDIVDIVADGYLNIHLNEDFDYSPALMFMGQPGVGKTAQVFNASQVIADANDWSLVINNPNPGDDEFGICIWQMANSSEEVVSGLPWVYKETDDGRGEQRRAMVTSLPRSGRGILYLDEVLQAPYTQRFAAQLCYDRRLDDYYTLPDGWMIVMSSNSARDRAGVTRMWTHFQNRVESYEVTPLVDGALNSWKVPPVADVAVFLKFNPGALHTFDARADGPYATARTWEMANIRRHAGADPIKDYVKFQALLGSEVATDYRATFHAIDKLPNLEELFADPDGNTAKIQAWRQNDPSVITAIAYVALRRLDAQRDVRFAAQALRVFEIAGVEYSKAFTSIARKIDERHADGDGLHEQPEFAKYLSRNAAVLAN